MKERKDYAVVLPGIINEDYFDKLSNSPEFIRERLREKFNQLEKVSITNDSEPVSALGNIFFRKFGESIDAKSLLKIFKPHVNKYVFEITNFSLRDYNNIQLTRSQAIDLQINDLAHDIAEQTNSKPDYNLSRRIIQKSHK